MTHKVRISQLREASSGRKAGYLEAVLSSAVRVTGKYAWIGDKDYMRLRSEYSLRTPAELKSEGAGPGTELKKLLAKIGIHASPTCKCNKMARKMDEWGPEESLKHIEEIVDVMEETAKKRKLPFLRTAGRSLVRLACWKARRR